MTDNMKNEAKISLYSLVWLVLISVFFISVGLKLSEVSGYSVAFNKIEYEGIKDALENMSVDSAADMAMFLLIAISSKPYMSLASASAILGLRGLSLGICAAFCAENAVSSASVAMMISYALVSVLMLLYAVFINRTKSGALSRLVIYLLITGAAVLLRALPMLLV